MRHVGRIVAVTIGLVGAGLLFGAMAGGASFALVGILAGQEISIEALEIGAVFGAPLGAITAPLLSWLLLRHVLSAPRLVESWDGLRPRLGGTSWSTPSWARLSDVSLPQSRFAIACSTSTPDSCSSNLECSSGW